MRRFLLDTGMAGMYIDRRMGVFARAQAEVRSGNRVGICLPVLAELVFGVEWSKSRERNLGRLQLALSSWKFWPATIATAFEYGRVSAELRRNGHVIQQNDIMISATAFSIGNCTVVTADGDFAHVPGLSVENWAK